MSIKVKILLLSLFLVSAITKCLCNEPDQKSPGPGYEKCQQQCQQRAQHNPYQQRHCSQFCKAKITEQRQQILGTLKACHERCDQQGQSSLVHKSCHQRCIEEEEHQQEAQKQNPYQGLGQFNQCQQLCQHVVRTVSRSWRCEENCFERMQQHEKEKGLNQMEGEATELPSKMAATELEVHQEASGKALPLPSIPWTNQRPMERRLPINLKPIWLGGM